MIQATRSSFVKEEIKRTFASKSRLQVKLRLKIRLIIKAFISIFI